MGIRFEPSPVYFMHLHKTGGTALGHWLRTGYNGCSYVNLRAERLDYLALAKLPRFRCFHSWHLGRGLYELIGRSDLPCITLLRDPIERAASALRHHQRTGLKLPERLTPAYLEQMQPWLTADMETCIRAGIMDEPLQNAQTRVLGNRRDYARLFRGAAQSDARTLLFSAYPMLNYPWLDMQMPDDDAGNFRRARAWLDEMAVVGLTERYAESLLLIGDLLGIPVPVEPPRANVNPQRIAPAMRYRDQLASDVVARLEELNHYDLELYAHAQDRFEQQWARYQARPQRTYSIAASVRYRLHHVGEKAQQIVVKQTPLLAQMYVDVRARVKRMVKQTPLLVQMYTYIIRHWFPHR